ncbi:MAG: hypothetical protein C4320_10170, partial [Armatimonadota bacterium]
SLGFMFLRTFDTTGTIGANPVPAITVPTEGGRFAALFARTADLTRFGNRLAWGARVDSPVTASIAVGNRWLYGASENGNIYAYSDLTNAGGTIGNDVIPPIADDVVDNDPDPNLEGFRNAEIGLLSRLGYVRLRETLPGTVTGTRNYSEVLGPDSSYTPLTGRLLPPYKSTKTDAVFEWGETIYLIAYNFPATTKDQAGNTIAPPVLEATVTTTGRNNRPFVSESRIFRDKTSSDTDGGYAILQIPLTSSGASALPPGPGTIQITLRTSAG